MHVSAGFATEEEIYRIRKDGSDACFLPSTGTPLHFYNKILHQHQYLIAAGRLLLKEGQNTQHACMYVYEEQQQKYLALGAGVSTTILEEVDR